MWRARSSKDIRACHVKCPQQPTHVPADPLQPIASGAMCIPRQVASMPACHCHHPGSSRNHAWQARPPPHPNANTAALLVATLQHGTAHRPAFTALHIPPALAAARPSRPPSVSLVLFCDGSGLTKLRRGPEADEADVDYRASQAAKHEAAKYKMTSASTWTVSYAFLSGMPPRTRRVVCVLCVCV